MTHIQRELEEDLINYFTGNDDQGLILAGIVGCGKTTLIKNCLKILAPKYEIFQFTGDDTVFRNSVQSDSKYLYEAIRGQTQNRVLVFIDEVQKSESIFDALKFLFDKGNASFIVSGSNPAYLNSTAKTRLQRRALFKVLFPFSLPEVLEIKLYHKQLKFITDLLQGNETDNIPRTEKTPKINTTIKRYLSVGGLPLSFLSENQEKSLLEVQKTFDRGFTPIREDANDITDSVAIELAHLHAKEFTYHNILKKTRQRQRDHINSVIENLLDHGYIGLVTPYIFNSEKKTYLKKYFYHDPGIITYLTGIKDDIQNIGYKIEGLIYSRLHFYLQKAITKNKGVYFFKKYTQSAEGQLRFKKGEVDAIYQIGNSVIPIEIKATSDWRDIDTKALQNFLKEHHLPFALVFYGGEPLKKGPVYFWPYWLL